MSYENHILNANANLYAQSNEHHKLVFGEKVLKFAHNFFVTFVKKTFRMKEMNDGSSNSNLRLKKKQVGKGNLTQCCCLFE